MNSKEFRIGNLIDRQDYICQVIKIDKEGIITEPLNYKGERFVMQKIKPIPLTSEWLERLGFTGEQTDPEYHRHYNLGEIGIEIPFDKSPMKISSVSNDWWLDTPLIYVHELQNLYYAITKDELVLAAAPPCP